LPEKYGGHFETKGIIKNQGNSRFFKAIFEHISQDKFYIEKKLCLQYKKIFSTMKIVFNFSLKLVDKLVYGLATAQS
jgi:hypothetical protein